MASELVKTGWLFIIIASVVLVLAGSALAADSSEGAEIFQQWCRTCHGDRGQGLTEEWRATWPKDEQNCWKSRCHAANHPPDGFMFPKEVPAVIGRDALARFNNAEQLYYYVRATMPYWSPNLLSDEEYRAVAIYLVEANYAERELPPPTSWDQDLASVPLRPASKSVDPDSHLPPWIPLLLLPIPVLLGLGIWVWYRSTSGTRAG